jgi:hypothetical protein
MVCHAAPMRIKTLGATVAALTLAGTVIIPSNLIGDTLAPPTLENNHLHRPNTTPVWWINMWTGWEIWNENKMRNDEFDFMLWGLLLEVAIYRNERSEWFMVKHLKIIEDDLDDNIFQDQNENFMLKFGRQIRAAVYRKKMKLDVKVSSSELM